MVMMTKTRVAGLATALLLGGGAVIALWSPQMSGLWAQASAADDTTGGGAGSAGPPKAGISPVPAVATATPATAPTSSSTATPPQKAATATPAAAASTSGTSATAPPSTISPITGPTTATSITAMTHADEECAKAFAEFVRTHAKRYASDDEKLRRFRNFQHRYDYIKSENANVSNTHRLGINEWSDESPDEFASFRLGYRQPKEPRGSLKVLGTHVWDGRKLGDCIDWRDKGAVNPVKNQAQCGSCWAFSTTGALEGALFLANGKLVSLSEQAFVDCNIEKGNSGCDGGNMGVALLWLQSKKKYTTEASYPYTQTLGTCKEDSLGQSVTISKVVFVQKDRASALMSAVARQPVSVAIEADQFAFQGYVSGVITKGCGTNLDHGVLAVGYGTQEGEKYFLVKNSWGASWGDNGYVKIGRGFEKSGGVCGILKEASYPEMR